MPVKKKAAKKAQPVKPLTPSSTNKKKDINTEKTTPKPKPGKG
jgi:hypothetical protein